MRIKYSKLKKLELRIFFEALKFRGHVLRKLRIVSVSNIDEPKTDVYAHLLTKNENKIFTTEETKAPDIFLRPS